MPAARHGQPVGAHRTRLVQAWGSWLALLAFHSFPTGDAALPLLSTLALVAFLSSGSRETIESWLPGPALLSFGSWQPNEAWRASRPRQAAGASLARRTLLSLCSVQALGTLNSLKAHGAWGTRRAWGPWLHYDLGQALL